ncbi:MAG: hypothetical protein V1843_01115 [bacterium]
MSISATNQYSFPKIDALLDQMDKIVTNTEVVSSKNSDDEMPYVEEYQAPDIEKKENTQGTIFSKAAFTKDESTYEIGILPFKKLQLALFYGSKNYVSSEEVEVPETEDEVTYRDVNVRNNYGGIAFNQRLGNKTVYLEATQGKDSQDDHIKEKKLTFALPDDKVVLRAEEYKYSNTDYKERERSYRAYYQVNDALRLNLGVTKSYNNEDGHSTNYPFGFTYMRTLADKENLWLGLKISPHFNYDRQTTKYDGIYIAVDGELPNMKQNGAFQLGIDCPRSDNCSAYFEFTTNDIRWWE